MRLIGALLLLAALGCAAKLPPGQWRQVGPNEWVGQDERGATCVLSEHEGEFVFEACVEPRPR